MSIKLFKDVLAYRLTQPVDAFTYAFEEQLNGALASKRSRQPASQELGTFGFVEPCGEEDLFVERFGPKSLLITAQQWKRDLPASVVNREVQGRVLKIEDQEQRKVYSKERNAIKTDVIIALLPRAFVKGKRVSALIQGDHIFIDTSSAKLAEALLSTLRECIGSLPVRPVTFKTRPTAYMTDTLRTGDTGFDEFELGESFQAKGASEEASTLSGKSVDLDEDEIRALLDGGRQVTQLELFQKEDADRVYFTLTEDGGLKSIGWPEALAQQSERDAGEDADVTTMHRATYTLVAASLKRLFEGVVLLLDGEENLGDAFEDSDFEKSMIKAARDIARTTRDYMAQNNAALVTEQGQTDAEKALDQADEQDEENITGSEGDALYSEAVAFVRESLRASISAVQRKLKIGYNRAARMIERMEEEGIVTSIDTAGSREVIREPVNRGKTPCENDKHTFLGNRTTGQVSSACVDCGFELGDAQPLVDDEPEDLI